MTDVTLYGSPLSLFTGRARSYLIKAGIDYTEVLPNSAHFKNNVLPKMGGRQSIPTIELYHGEVIRDGAAIIDHFEANSGHRFSPETPKQKILSLLFDVIGCEGLLRPAMHYRWNFPEQNLEFLQFHFESFVPEGLDRGEIARKRMDQMRGAGRMFGVLPDTYMLVESLYLTLIEKLNLHFAAYPYLFGHKPSVGDFGLVAPLYGHLGRDPKPLSLMQAQGVCLFRWVERMNRPEADIGEFGNQHESYLREDEIPQTLIDVLKHLSLDFVPETKAACRFINSWLDDNEAMKSGTIAERGVGSVEFEVDQVKINALAQPYRFYLLSRVQDVFESLDGNDRAAVKVLLEECNMSEVLECRLSRQIGRENNREVWL